MLKNSTKLHSILDILNWSANQFKIANIYYGHGSDNPWDEALQLVLPSLNLPIDVPEILLNKPLSYTSQNYIIKLVSSRINGRVPAAYLTNKSWFCSHEFYVDQRVLIPRSPIGELIENNFSGLIYHKPKHILDMCTGSGCIAIACAYAFPETKVDAVDISTDALAVAKFNIKNHNLTHRVNLFHSDLFHNLSTKNKYDLIVTNPPYVDIKDIFNLPNEYHYEPIIALLANQDGLQFILRILHFASDYLTEDGVLICEVGDTMINLVEKYPDIPFTWLEFDNGGNGVFMLTKMQLTAMYRYF